MSYLQQTKNFNTFMEVLLRDPERYLPLVELRDQMTLYFKELSWAECEIIGAVISENNKSEFCTGIRYGIADALGVGKEALENEKYKSLMTFSNKLNKDASSIQQADIQAVRDSGWSDQTIEDVIGLVAMTNAFNTLAKGMGFSGVPDSVFKKMGEASVNKEGYAPLFRSFLEGAQNANHGKSK